MTSSSPSDPPAESGPPPSPAARLDADRPAAYPGTIPPAWAALHWMRRHRRRTVLLLVVLLVAGGGVAGLGDLLRRLAYPASAPVAAGRNARLGNDADARDPAKPSGYPTEGSGQFVAARGDSPVRGYEGPLQRYRVAVEEGVGQDADEFAGAVDTVLGDPRSWIASGWLRVQRVAEVDAADFTIYLATPATSERMCVEGGLSTERYTSCRLPGRVIINLARWMEAVPDYEAPLEVYRAYVINHEVGHEFGELHQACPGPGMPAPVMQQQTYGLDGCVANAWPYLDGVRYEGAFIDGL